MILLERKLMGNTVYASMRNDITIILFSVVLLFMRISCKKQSDALSLDRELTNPKPDCKYCSILFIGSSYLSIAGNDAVEVFEKLSDEGGKKY